MDLPFQREDKVTASVIQDVRPMRGGAVDIVIRDGRIKGIWLGVV